MTSNQSLSPVADRRAAVLLLGALLAACSGGSGGGGGDALSASFDVTEISVSQGQVWEVNRPIVMDFSRDVDFSTVNFNTVEISILDPQNPSMTGVPATGVFTLVDPSTVEFQPTCPTQDDFSDSGFQPGGYQYRIQILGTDSSPLTVKSTGGDPLKASQVRTFTTPVTLVPQVLFLDVVPGAPIPVIRGDFDGTEVVSLDAIDATRVEVDDVTYEAGYIEFDGSDYSIPFDLPLNLYSSPNAQISFVLEINQPVNPTSSNINSENLYVEVETSPGSGTFERIPTLVELEANCTESGARVRLRPQGVLPQDSLARAVIGSGFQDLTGESNLLAIDNRVRIATEVVDNSPLPDPTQMGDGWEELFILSGDEPGSFEDTDAAFPEPRALWGDDELRAAFAFDGDGGPGGNFDFLVEDGVTININTVASTISGGPNALSGAPSTTQAVINGQINVRNLRIEEGGVLQAVGPNPLVIQATGNVEVFGLLSVDGGDAKDVATLNTGNQPETGAAGNAGGGSGGTGSFLTTTSTPKGGDANGAFNQPGLGGKGGESGFAPGGKDNRRPGGGGGGRFGPDEGTALGMTAEPGHNGSPNATGAIFGQKPPKGGDPGNSPFVDEDPDNNFFGKLYDEVTDTLITGELSSVWAGGGGGAGGDAVPGSAFPSPSWTPASDEKGAGGGGGAGGLVILSLGDLRFGQNGLISAIGGDGGSGENTIYNDHVGGGSGGGSGGHVIIQARAVDFTNDGAVAAPANNRINARGGLAGAGQSGVNSTNAGGNGGPGMVQVHVPTTDEILTGTKTLDDLTNPNAILPSPLFGSVSKAISKWVPLGGAAGATFTFGGTDPITGLVLDDDMDEEVDSVPPILGPKTLTSPPSKPSITPDGRTLKVKATKLVGTPDDIYLRNPALLRGFALDLLETASPSNTQRYDVVAASYNGDTSVLTLVVPSTGPTLTSFLSINGLTPEEVKYKLVPRFFLVRTDGEDSFLPATATIDILLQGTVQDATGQPLLPPVVDWTGNIEDLNMEFLDFVRVQFTFDIAVDSDLSENSPRPALEFFKLPFRF